MPEKNYYAILEVSKSSSDAEIKKAYRKLAMKWHPDKNPENAQESSKIFHDIGEAYDVLSNYEKRAIYDRYGYEGLTNGIPGEDSVDRYRYHDNAQEIFENFFGTANPFATFGNGENLPFASKLNKPGPKKLDPYTVRLPCSLAELYSGCVKKFNVTRKRYNSSQELCDEDKLLIISVKPGWKKGTKITFPCDGDEKAGFLPADVVLVIEEEAEQNIPYKRDGNNLIYTYKLSLSDALTDCSLQIPTLDKRFLSIACPEVVSPFYEKVIPGEGMPLPKKPESKGDLIVRFHILFPKYLNGQKRLKLKELLANEDLQN